MRENSEVQPDNAAIVEALQKELQRLTDQLAPDAESSLLFVPDVEVSE